jgi:hypothetical protein
LAKVGVLVALVLVGATAVRVPGASSSRPNAHQRALAYWFWTGYLPDGSGVRTKHQFDECCNNQNYTRISWTVGSHDMRLSLVDYGGNWHGIDISASGGYDQSWVYDTYLFAQGGCNNPAPLFTVWVNCHVGNSQ